MTARVEILYFTDPFCSWCWATEPALFTLRERFGPAIRIRYVLGGLVQDMTTHNMSEAEVAPHWRMVSERSGQPIDERLWTENIDPHLSSFPAAISIKAAECQGLQVGSHYLRRLRRAALTERAHIHRREVQLRLAAEVPGLNLNQFLVDLGSPEAARAFQADLEQCRAYDVTGFPTMLFRALDDRELNGDAQGIMLYGHRSLDTYLQILDRLAPGLTAAPPRPPLALLAAYGPLTSRELSMVLGESVDDLESEMRALDSAGKVNATTCPGGVVWSLQA